MEVDHSMSFFAATPETEIRERKVEVWEPGADPRSLQADRRRHQNRRRNGWWRRGGGRPRPKIGGEHGERAAAGWLSGVLLLLFACVASCLYY